MVRVREKPPLMAAIFTPDDDGICQVFWTDVRTNTCENLPAPLQYKAVGELEQIHDHAMIGHSVWSTAIIRSSFILPPYTSILERAVSISRRSAGVSWTSIALRFSYR